MTDFSFRDKQKDKPAEVYPRKITVKHVQSRRSYICRFPLWFH